MATKRHRTTRLLLVLLMFMSVGDQIFPRQAFAQVNLASRTEEVKEFLKPYRAALRSLGQYFQGPTVKDREDPTFPEKDTKIVLPSNSSEKTLDFTLSKSAGSGIRIYHLRDDPGTEEADDYVTNIFFVFQKTSAEGPEISLVLDPVGIGAIYLGSNPDPTSNSSRVYGEPENCIEVKDENDPESAKLNLKNCLVSVGSVADEKAREKFWEKFASYMIPEKLWSKCPLPSETTDSRPAGGTPGTQTSEPFPLAPFGSEAAYAAGPLLVALWGAVRWCGTQLVRIAATRWGQAAIATAVLSWKVLKFSAKKLWELFKSPFGAVVGLYAIGTALAAILCEIDEVIKGGIGAIFLNIARCLFEEVFRPMIGWAAKLLQQAAGLSYYYPSTRQAINYHHQVVAHSRT